MKKFAALISFFALLTGCSLQDMDQNKGVIWDTYTDGPVVAGMEIHDNNLFCADAYGNIYSLWMDTGSIRWKRTLLSETVTGVYATSNTLIAISVTPTFSVIRHYSFEEGNILFQTNLFLQLKDSYTADGQKIILHTASKVLVYDSLNNSLTIRDFGPYIANIVTIVKGDNCFYLINDQSLIVKTSLSFDYITAYYDFNNTGFYGSAVYSDNMLLIATAEGIKKMSSLGIGSSTSMSWRILYAPMKVLSDPFQTVIFTGMSGSQRSGLGRYSLIMNNLSEDFYKPMYGGVSYSPIAYSDSVYAVGAVDDNGILNVFDSVTGKFVYSKYIGFINRPNLKIVNDYYSKSVFIPVSVPSKIVCYSLYYAMNQGMY